jgi:hypothetical protein
LRGEGRGEGLFFEFGRERLENPVQILNDLVVPDADHAITAGAEVAVALPVVRAIRMLAAIEFYDQAPLAVSAAGEQLLMERDLFPERIEKAGRSLISAS